MSESPTVRLTLRFHWLCPNCNDFQTVGAFQVTKTGFDGPGSRTDQSLSPKEVRCTKCESKYRTLGFEPITHCQPEGAP